MSEVNVKKLSYYHVNDPVDIFSLNEKSSKFFVRYDLN